MTDKNNEGKIHITGMSGNVAGGIGSTNSGQGSGGNVILGNIRKECLVCGEVVGSSRPRACQCDRKLIQGENTRRCKRNSLNFPICRYCQTDDPNIESCICIRSEENKQSEQMGSDENQERNIIQTTSTSSFQAQSNSLLVDKLLSNKDIKYYEGKITEALKRQSKKIKKVIVFFVPELGLEEKVSALTINKIGNKYSLELVKYDKNTSSLEFLPMGENKRDDKRSIAKEVVNIELSKQTEYLKKFLKETKKEKRKQAKTQARVDLLNLLKEGDKNNSEIQDQVKELSKKIEEQSLKSFILKYRLDYIKAEETDKGSETAENLLDAYKEQYNSIIKEEVIRSNPEFRQYIETIEQSSLVSLNTSIDAATTAATVTGVFVKTFVQVIDPGIGDIIGGIGAILKSFR